MKKVTIMTITCFLYSCIIGVLLPKNEIKKYDQLDKIKTNIELQQTGGDFTCVKPGDVITFRIVNRVFAPQVNQLGTNIDSFNISIPGITEITWNSPDTNGIVSGAASTDGGMVVVTMFDAADASPNITASGIADLAVISNTSNVNTSDSAEVPCVCDSNNSPTPGTNSCLIQPDRFQIRCATGQLETFTDTLLINDSITGINQNRYNMINGYVDVNNNGVIDSSDDATALVGGGNGATPRDVINGSIVCNGTPSLETFFDNTFRCSPQANQTDWVFDITYTVPQGYNYSADSVILNATAKYSVYINGSLASTLNPNYTSESQFASLNLTGTGANAGADQVVTNVSPSSQQVYNLAALPPVDSSCSGAWTGAPAGASYSPDSNTANATVTFPAGTSGQRSLTWTVTCPNGCAGSDDIIIDISLPVRLSYFDARKVGADAYLKWGTVQERNNAYFEVERSTNGIDFTSVGKIDGHATTSLPKYYSWIDTQAGEGQNFYRLSQVDHDGNREIHGVRLLNFISAQNEIYIYPNPFHSNLSIQSQYEIENISVYSPLGGVIYQKDFPEVNNLELNHLPQGVYFINVKTEIGNKSFKVLKR